MSITSHRYFPWVCAGFLVSAQVLAADPSATPPLQASSTSPAQTAHEHAGETPAPLNPLPAPGEASGSLSQLSPPATADATTQAMANGYLQIQEQLHAAQLAIQEERQTFAAAAKRNTDEMAARIQALEQTIAAQRADEADAARKAEQLTFYLAGAFGLAALGIMLLMVYFQWRAFTQLAEISARASGGGRRGLALAEANQELPAPSANARAGVEAANSRLFGAVEQLERRIRELEQGARPALAATITAPASAPAKHEANPDADREECIANLIAEGQSALNANEPEKALECYDTALQLEPKHISALIEKGSALEKLGRFDEAFACYDQAIEADGSTTIAYLHKGGLFNRLARYDEALQCYERALHAQEKKAPAEKAA